MKRIKNKIRDNLELLKKVKDVYGFLNLLIFSLPYYISRNMLAVLAVPLIEGHG